MTTIRLRRGTSAQWVSANPVLADGEFGWDSTAAKLKMGNGAANWAGLPYFLDSAINSKVTAPVDPNADRILFWDDSANKYENLNVTGGLAIVGTDLSVISATELLAGRVELATALETLEGIDATRAVHPAGLKPLLDKKENKGDRVAYVEDYLDVNRVEGVTDDRPAFESARLTGKPVRAKAGIFYISRAPDWGDNANFVGAGVDKTIIKLLDSAVQSADVWSNASLAGTVQGYFADFTLDGNCMRQGGFADGGGGSRGSCLVLRNVKHFYVDRVKAINPAQHCFDVTRGSLDYAYVGDGVLATLRSENVYFNQLQGTNFGDDAFTTHSSDFVHVSNSIFYNPRNRGNCNGIEFDGDSRYCTATNNRTYNCYSGIEVKGHGSESAAQGITINGHIDTGSVRSYSFRHIGFHGGADPVSLSAKDITATNLVSIHPNNDAGFQDDATPRALSISAYHNVSIAGFTTIGRGNYTDDAIAIQVQYRARNISITGINIRNWLGAFADISVTTGDVVTLGGNIEHSAKRALYVGSNVETVNLVGLNATAPIDGSALHGLDLYSDTSANAVQESYGVSLRGYVNPVRAGGVNYSSWALFMRRIRDIPVGTTRLIDLPPAYTYYGSSGAMNLLTDHPSIGGAAIIEHSDVSDVYVQTVTRNTTGATLQAQAWRICYINLTTGPWNRVVLASDVSVSDTGFRNIGQAFTNGWTGYAEDVILSRDGNIVSFSAKVNSTSATADGFITLPVGFRPEAADWMALACYNSVGTGRWGRVYPDGVVSCSRPAPLGWHHIAGSWKTSDAWPSALPGVVRTQ